MGEAVEGLNLTSDFVLPETRFRQCNSSMVGQLPTLLQHVVRMCTNH